MLFSKYRYNKACNLHIILRLLNHTPGPGFDVIGLALSVWLELQMTLNDPSSQGARYNCRVTYEGLGKDDIELEADRNLITQTALYVLRCHGRRGFPEGTHVHIVNPIPLGRGLGSSGAAVVAGVSLANEVAELRLSKDRTDAERR